MPLSVKSVAGLLLLLSTVLLTGCSSRYSDHGNITQVELSPPEQQQVAADISATLSAAFGARTVFDFPHSRGNTFAGVLADQLRGRGFGVNTQETPGYNTALRYRLVSLNPQQFYVQVDAGGRQFTRLWSSQGNVLAPLSARAQRAGGA